MMKILLYCHKYIRSPKGTVCYLLKDEDENEYNQRIVVLLVFMVYWGVNRNCKLKDRNTVIKRKNSEETNDGQQHATQNTTD